MAGTSGRGLRAAAFLSAKDQSQFMMKIPFQNTHQWGYHSLGNGRYFAADFCPLVQRMNFELVFGCGAMFYPASFFYFCVINDPLCFGIM